VAGAGCRLTIRIRYEQSLSPATAAIDAVQKWSFGAPGRKIA
jgi:hypothetical protein